MPEYDITTPEGRAKLREICKQESQGYFFEKGERLVKILQSFPRALDRIDQLEAKLARTKFQVGELEEVADNLLVGNRELSSKLRPESEKRQSSNF